MAEEALVATRTTRMRRRRARPRWRRSTAGQGGGRLDIRGSRRRSILSLDRRVLDRLRPGCASTFASRPDLERAAAGDRREWLEERAVEEDGPYAACWRGRRSERAAGGVRGDSSSCDGACVALSGSGTRRGTGPRARGLGTPPRCSRLSPALLRARTRRHKLARDALLWSGRSPSADPLRACGSLICLRLPPPTRDRAEQLAPRPAGASCSGRSWRLTAPGGRPAPSSRCAHRATRRGQLAREASVELAQLLAGERPRRTPAQTAPERHGVLVAQSDPASALAADIMSKGARQTSSPASLRALRARAAARRSRTPTTPAAADHRGRFAVNDAAVAAGSAGRPRRLQSEEEAQSTWWARADHAERRARSRTFASSETAAGRRRCSPARAGCARQALGPGRFRSSPTRGL